MPCPIERSYSSKAACTIVRHHQGHPSGGALQSPLPATASSSRGSSSVSRRAGCYGLDSLGNVVLNSGLRDQRRRQLSATPLHFNFHLDNAACATPSRAAAKLAPCAIRRALGEQSARLAVPILRRRQRFGVEVLHTAPFSTEYLSCCGLPCLDRGFQNFIGCINSLCATGTVTLGYHALLQP